jgi:Complex 1 protein (LYR family)
LCHAVTCDAEGIRQYIRDGFAVHQAKKDPYDIKYALSDGREQLKRWKESMSLSVKGVH